jgi:hypothetical protein
LHAFLPIFDERRSSIFEHDGAKRKCHFGNSDAPCWSAGYLAMGMAIDLNLFTPKEQGRR